MAVTRYEGYPKSGAYGNTFTGAEAFDIVYDTLGESFLDAVRKAGQRERWWSILNKQLLFVLKINIAIMVIGKFYMFVFT